METELVAKPKYLLGRIANKYIILDIMLYAFYFYKQKGINLLVGTSRSFRQLLIENYKYASLLFEDVLDNIEKLMPFTVSQIYLPIAKDRCYCPLFVYLSGDRVYTA
jgi:hypothetical protein